MKALILATALLGCAAEAQAACPDTSLMRNAARGWIVGQWLPDPLVRNIGDARCGYESFRAVLQSELGPPVGVKVGLTSAEMQRRFGSDQPITGALFAPMLVADGSRLSLKGSRNPQFKADLVVTVGSSTIMQARTREEVAANLRDVRPFIELPDFALSGTEPPTAPLLAVYGAVPWRGVLGKGIPLSELADPVGDLAAMTVALKVDGRTAVTARGDALMGNPLDVVLWLLDQGGYDLKPGSIIALGSFGEIVPAAPGQRLEAEYNLAGRPMRVGVTLVP